MERSERIAPARAQHAPTPRPRPSGRATSPADCQRRELWQFLFGTHVPQKDEILRVKHLVRTLSGDEIPPTARIADAEGFLSGYLDLYLGRLTGDPRIERDGRRRCLDCLGGRRLDGAPPLP